MDDYDQKLKDLFENFRRQLPVRLQTCLSAWDTYINNNDKEGLNQLRFQTHKLAGAASIYGFESIGNSARSIEIMVDNYYNGDFSDQQGFISQLLPELNTLKELILATAELSD